MVSRSTNNFQSDTRGTTVTPNFMVRSFPGSLASRMLSGPGAQFERDQPRQQGRRIELSENGFDIGEAAREGVDRYDVAVAHGGEGGEAEIDEVARQRRPVGHRQALERARRQG